MTGQTWTFRIEPGQGHGQGLDKATPFMLSWIGGVIRQRVGGRAL
jgi:hypothetical protein